MYVSVTCSLGSTETFSLLALCDRDHAPHFPGLHHLPNPPFYSPGNDRQTMWRSNSHGLCSRSDGCSANAPVINIMFVNSLFFLKQNIQWHLRCHHFKLCLWEGRLIFDPWEVHQVHLVVQPTVLSLLAILVGWKRWLYYNSMWAGFFRTVSLVKSNLAVFER